MILEEIQKKMPGFTKSEKQVAEYILAHANAVIELSISEIAALTNTSDATIIRFCKRLGLNGVYQLKINLSNELGNSGYLVGGKQEDTNHFSKYWKKVESNITSLSQNLDEKIIEDSIETIITHFLSQLLFSHFP